LVGTYDNYNMQFLTNNIERMRIDTSGNVLVGTTAATGKLVCAGTFSVLDSGNVGYQTVILSSNGLSSIQAYQAGSQALAFETTNSGSAAERMRIDSSGNLMVGTTSAVSSAKVTIYQTVNPCAYFWNADTSGDNYFVGFGTEGSVTTRGTITYNRAGGLVAYNVTSDYRAKDIIGPVTDAGATIDALKVYAGKMHGATVTRPMLIAHEAQSVAPYSVTGEKDAVNEDGSPNYQQIDHSALIPLLIAELQSLRARVAQLEGN
jgi:hypothetical protein